MKIKLLSFAKIIFLVCFFIYLVLFFSVNLWFMPNSYHLAIGSKNTSSNEYDILTLTTSRWTSFLFAKYDLNKCDAYVYKDGKQVSGKNAAIGALMALYDNPAYDKNSVLTLLNDRVSSCDVNFSKESEPTPLQGSIILHQPMLVSLLLTAGARTDLRMPIRGKRTDNMNALELATLMTTGKLNKEKMLAANKILTLLQEHEKNKKFSER